VAAEAAAVWLALVVLVAQVVSPVVARAPALW
jgi:hypothetical protein